MRLPFLPHNSLYIPCSFIGVHYHYITYTTFAFLFTIRILSTSFFSSHEPLPLLITILYPYHNSPLLAAPSPFNFYHRLYLLILSFVGSLLSSYTTPTRLQTSFDYPANLHSTPTYFPNLLSSLRSNSSPQTNISFLAFPYIPVHVNKLLPSTNLATSEKPLPSMYLRTAVFIVLHSLLIARDRHDFKLTLPPFSFFQHHVYYCPLFSLPSLGSSLSTLSVTPRHLCCLASSYTIIHTLSQVLTGMS